jgi:hypothetical protein
MGIPGFTAEASLLGPRAGYQQASVPADGGGNSVVPQLTSCGTCTELKWPNGTGTGACARACCRTTPSPGGGRPITTCTTETCSCGPRFDFGGLGGLLRF